HLAAMWYEVTLLNATAPVVLSSEMIANEPTPRRDNRDPRQAKVFVEKVLNHRLSYARDQRIVLCHATGKSGLILSCSIEHILETSSPPQWKPPHTQEAGKVVAPIKAKPGHPTTLVK